MTKAYDTFCASIADSKRLLTLFDTINTQSEFETGEALKRSTLIMISASWETYIEDLLLEQVSQSTLVLRGSRVGRFITAAADLRIKQLHNPNSQKVTRRHWSTSLGS